MSSRVGSGAIPCPGDTGVVVTGRECARLRSPSDDGDEAEGKDIGRGLGEAAEAGDGEIRGGSRITVVARGVGLGQWQGRDGRKQKFFYQEQMGRAPLNLCEKVRVCRVWRRVSLVHAWH